MNKRSIEILNAIIRNDTLSNNLDWRLVIIENRKGSFCGNHRGPYVSVKDLTAEDFFEIYRYKKSENEEKISKSIDRALDEVL